MPPGVSATAGNPILYPPHTRRAASRCRHSKRDFKLSVRPELLAALSGAAPVAAARAPPAVKPTDDADDSSKVIDAFINDLARRRHVPGNASDVSTQSAAGASTSGTSDLQQQPRRRRAAVASRTGSGRVTTARDFTLEETALPEPRRLCLPSGGPSTTDGGSVAQLTSPVVDPAPADAAGGANKAVSIKMRVLRRPRRAIREAELASLGPSRTPARTVPPPPRFATPAPPSSLKAQGAWYVDHCVETPAAAASLPSSSLDAPSTLKKAPGAWYVDHIEADEGTPPGAAGPQARRWAAPATQVKAKGCWYMDPEATPAPSVGPVGRPPLSSKLKAPAEGATLGGADSSVEPPRTRSLRKRKTVGFDTDGMPGSEVPRLLASYASTGGAKGGRPTPSRGVLTNLRNTYVATPASGGGSGGRKPSAWRVEYGEGLSPYSFSPVPMRIDEPAEAGSEDMELDDDCPEEAYDDGHEEVHSAPQGKGSGGDSCDVSTQCSTPSLAAAAADPHTPGTAVARRDKRKSTSNQRLRRASACALTPGLNRAGTRMVDGVRRSSRQRYQPLEYWRNEHKEYARCLSSMPTVVNIATRTPEAPVNRRKSKARARPHKH
eukprot:jgi/Tetstr1/449825/TSEL_036888.t2